MAAAGRDRRGAEEPPGLTVADALADTGLDRLDAELLLAEALGRSRTWLFAHPEAPLSEAERQRFGTLLAARRQGQPIAHLTGRRSFWTQDLAVSADTLIPRPDTELVVEVALQNLAAESPVRVLDLGTGTGAIALAIASERPLAWILATDRHPGAVQLARRNALLHRLGNVRFLCGDWFDPLRATGTFDLVVSNPPYLAEDDPHLARGDLRFEPRSALVAADAGLADLTDLARQAARFLKFGGVLILEHGWTQQEAVLAQLAGPEWIDQQGHHDLAGRPRAVTARRAEVQSRSGPARR